MALIYKDDTYGYEGKVVSSLNRFKQAERRLALKKQALEDMQNEYELIELQAFNTYKQNVQYLMLDQKKTINICEQWQTMLSKNQDVDGNKLDKRRKYKEKETYDWYIEYIRNLLGVEEMNDIKFIDDNFGQGTYIEFGYKEHMWRLHIPHINNLRLKEYQYYGSGLFKLALSYKDSACSWTQFGSTYEEDELKDIMVKGIEKYCAEK